MDNEGNGVMTKVENVLEDIASIYTQESYGLLSISKLKSIQKVLKRKVFLPEKKVIVLIIGGHSTGKSSFVNWYFGDNIQKVSAAIETSKITFITTGRKRQTFDGNTTLKIFDFLESYKNIPNFVNNLQTEKRLPLKERASLITFIDTPGLIPDKNRLAYDSEEILLKLSRHANLIFIFNDPIGQAFSEPLLDYVERSHDECRNKMYFFLTKSDTIEENEKNRIVASIAQTLPNKISRTTIDVRPFHLPKKDIEKMRTNGTGIGEEEEDSEIDDNSSKLKYICEIIQKSVDNTVQSNLSQLSKDLSDLTRAAEESIHKMKRRKNHFLISTTLFITVLVYFIIAFNSRRVHFSSNIYIFLFISFILFIFSLIMKPSNSELKKLQLFRDNTAKKAKVRLDYFYHQIKDD